MIQALRTGMFLLMISFQEISAAEWPPGHAPVSVCKQPSQTNPTSWPEGKILLQFWASWCHSCGVLFWDMKEIMNQVENTTYLAVSIDGKQEDACTYAQKQHQYKVSSGPFLFDKNGLLASRFRVGSVPTILVLNHEGHVILRKEGHLNSADKRDIILVIKREQSNG